MSNQGTPATSVHASSTGQAFTDSGWLDAHFEACRTEYEVMLRSVSFQPGWQVLDAGSGSGSFLPLLAEVVGPSGQITALDLAPENVANVQERIKGWALPVPVQTKVGTLVELPLLDGQFDAVWCANATQYLSDTELAIALQEFRRVTRPGGLVAIKDHAGAIRIEPAPPYFIERNFDAGWKQSAKPGLRAPGAYRGPTLRTLLREAGFKDVWARSTLIERWAPLRPVEQALWRDALRSFAGRAPQLDLSADDLAIWRELSEPAGAAAFVAQPDFYCREMNVVAVGRVP